MAAKRTAVRLDAELSTEERNNLKGTTFVFPKERRYPIPDMSHARNALARASGKSEESAVKAAVFKKFPSLKEHSKHDPESPKDDCAHCMHDSEGKEPAHEAQNRQAAMLASEHDSKHGRHEDCPFCKARKDGACDAHAAKSDDNLALNGPIPSEISPGGETEEPMRGEPGEGSPAKVEADPDEDDLEDGRQEPMRAHTPTGGAPEADPDEDDLEDETEEGLPGAHGAENFHGDDTLAPNGPVAVATSTGGEMEQGQAGNLGSPLQPPAPEDENALAEGRNPPQKGSNVDPWLPSGKTQVHPLMGKQVRMLHRAGNGGSLGEDGGRITHGTLGKVVDLDQDGNTALVDWEGHGKARTSLINLEEAKMKPPPERADGVTRFDRGELEKPEFMANGWVKVDGFIARSGMLRYTTDDGKPWIEYRPPEEAFDAKTLDSFGLVPLTNTHPPSGLLDAENTSQYAVGSVDTPRKDGDKVRARMLVTDADAVAAMKRGRVEVSCGYTCDVDNKPGTIDGVRYDAIQRNVRGNHVALVDVGRAGSEVRVRMDGLGMVQLPSDAEKDPLLATKIKIDGVEFDVSDSGAQAFRKYMDNAAREIEKLKARADSSEAQSKKLQAELKVAPEKARAAIEARVAVETDARKVLGTDAKFDGLSDLEVKRLAAEKHLGGTKLDDKKDEYVEAVFDMAVKHADGSNTDADGILAPRKPTEGTLENAQSEGDKNVHDFLEKSMSASQPKSRK